MSVVFPFLLLDEAPLLGGGVIISFVKIWSSLTHAVVNQKQPICYMSYLNYYLKTICSLPENQIYEKLSFWSAESKMLVH